MFYTNNGRAGIEHWNYHQKTRPYRYIECCLESCALLHLDYKSNTSYLLVHHKLNMSNDIFCIQNWHHHRRIRHCRDISCYSESFCLLHLHYKSNTYYLLIHHRLNMNNGRPCIQSWHHHRRIRHCTDIYCFPRIYVGYYHILCRFQEFPNTFRKNNGNTVHILYPHNLPCIGIDN